MTLRAVQPMLPTQQRGVGTGQSNGYRLDAFIPEHSQVYVHVTAIGGGTLDIKLQDSWEDTEAKYSNTGDQSLGIAADGITRIPPAAVKGKYLRAFYEVKTAAVTFGVFFVKKEEQ